ncbi:MAG: glycosyltransferase family 4 protein [Verrucomicrobia bacterium]|nr:glycosyltransferase family 4 protein [Verrucomicrobiota bacterium]
MKIAFISTILGHPWGGADSLWTRAAEAAVENHHRVLLCISSLTATHERIVALKQRGALLNIRPSYPPRPSLAGRIFQRVLRHSSDPFVSVLDQFAPDLLIISCGGTYDLVAYPELCAWLLATHQRFRIIANWQRENPTEGDDERSAIVSAFVAADMIAFVSTRNLEATRRHLRQPLPNAVVLHNPLRLPRSDVTAWPSTPPWRLATVSRLAPEKGIGLLFPALSAAIPASEPWELHVYGRGPEEAHLRAAAKQHGLERNVFFEGQIEDLADIWRDNHLLVSPALEEGVPMTIPEAMLCARPVLATNVGGAEDWLMEGATGYLCPAPTIPLLESTLRAAWKDRARWPQWGAAALIAARHHYRPNDYLRLVN